MAVNKVILKGRLTADLELRKTRDGKDFISFNIAVNRNYKDKDGNYPTDFFKALANSHNATFISKHFSKGDEIIIVGSLYTSQYEDKNGNKRTDTYINVSEADFGAKKNGTAAEKTDYLESNAEMFEELKDIEGDLPF